MLYTFEVRTLFVDCDGVLHPEFCHESRHFSCLPYFEQSLQSHPDVGVVISSTWRLHRSLDDLRSHFSSDIAQRIIGVTPRFSDLQDVPESLLGYEREAECHAWLRTHDRAALPWLTVDDRPWLYRPFNKSLFLVDGKTGITTSSAQALMERLQKL